MVLPRLPFTSFWTMVVSPMASWAWAPDTMASQLTPAIHAASGTRLALRLIVPPKRMFYFLCLCKTKLPQGGSGRKPVSCAKAGISSPAQCLNRRPAAARCPVARLQP